MDRVTLVGPASPRDLAPFLSGADRERALAHHGYRGVPVSELAGALVNSGLLVEIVTMSAEVDNSVNYQGDRLAVTVVPMRARARHRALDFFAEERRQLERALRSADGEVVHAHWTYEFAWAALCGDRPVVVTAHDAPLTIALRFRDAYRMLRTALAYRVRPMIGDLTAVSPYLAMQWRRQMAYRAPIAVVPNVAPRPSAPSDAVKSATPVILEISDSSRLKNVGTLVRAHAVLLERGVSAELQIVGPGLGEDDELAQRLRSEGLGEGVAFCGSIDRDEVGARLAAASVFAHSSYEECCPMSVLEALAAGVPVVAGRTSGGTPWVLGEGKWGHLADVSAPGPLADAIERLLTDGTLATELAERGREAAERLFSGEAVVAGYRAVYERVLARSTRLRAQLVGRSA